MNTALLLFSIAVIFLGILTIFGNINPNPPGLPSGIPPNYLSPTEDMYKSDDIVALYRKHENSDSLTSMFTYIREEIDSAVIELNFIVSIMESDGSTSASLHTRSKLSEAIDKADRLLMKEPNRYSRRVHKFKDGLRTRLSRFGI